MFFVSCLLFVPAFVLMPSPNSIFMTFISGPPTERSITYESTSYIDIHHMDFTLYSVLAAIFALAWLIMSVVMILRDKISNFFFILGIPSMLFAMMANFFRGSGTVYTVVISLLLIAAFVLQFLAVRESKKSNSEEQSHAQPKRDQQSFIK